MMLANETSDMDGLNEEWGMHDLLNSPITLNLMLLVANLVNTK